MVSTNVKEKLDMPKGITASYSNGSLEITGEKGTVTRVLRDPSIQIKTNDGEIIFDMKTYSKNEKKLSRTFMAHARNMVKGVTEGHEYKLKICSGHFPMNITVKNTEIEVKNFIGEAVPRKLSFKEGVKVELNGDIITVTGIDKEVTAQTAASIEKLTRRNGFDRRIFQDGIYIIEKDGKKLE